MVRSQLAFILFVDLSSGSTDSDFARGRWLRSMALPNVPSRSRCRHQGALTRRGVAEPTDVNDPDAIEIVACGRPVPGHEIRIVDEAGREVQERREGRLEFRGPSATSGYFHNEAKTRELFRGGWLDSGDQAYIANGDVFITGRIKDIIIRAGQHVYPHELEEAVGDIAGATKGAVAAFGVSDRASGTERIVLLAETAQTATAELESLKARARAVVTEIIGSPPDDIVFVEPGTVPKTSSGKIRRAAAKEHYLAQQLTVPRRALKWQIARLWLGGVGGRLTRLGEAAREYLYAAWWWGILSICVTIGAIAVWILPRRKWRWAVVRTLARAPLVAMGIPISVKGAERLPKQRGMSSTTPAISTRSWLQQLFRESRPIWSKESFPANFSLDRCCADWVHCSSNATS